MIVLPALIAAALLGWSLRALTFGRTWMLPVAFTALCLGAAAILAGRRASLDLVPAAVAAQLPDDTGALSALCFDELAAADRRAARREVRALVRELARRPEELVTVRFDDAESDGYVDEEYTVRDLADETLESSTCPSPEATDLRRALTATR